MLSGLKKCYREADNYGKADLLRAVGAKFLLTQDNQIVVEYKEPFKAIYEAKRLAQTEDKEAEKYNVSIAGRIMSRRQAFRTLDLEDFRQSMQWIYSETVTAQTMDEAPMVYKPKDEIIANIQDTVTIKKIIKPVFNYKAAGD